MYRFNIYFGKVQDLIIRNQLQSVQHIWGYGLETYPVVLYKKNIQLPSIVVIETLIRMAKFTSQLQHRLWFNLRRIHQCYQ